MHPLFNLNYVISYKASEVCGSVEMDSTLEVVDSLIEDLAAIRVAVEARKLLPLPGESVQA